MMNGMCAMNEYGNLGVLWKTVSEDCNLACNYCYYSNCGGKPGPRINRIDSAVLEKFIREYMAMSQGSASFAWQGGEPLLAGLDFFKEVVSLQAAYAPAHTAISNALQTNGTLITDEWAAFFRKYRFLVGVSIDGPLDIHDARRVDSRGQGSFDRVMRGVDYLRRHGVDFNILTVLHRGNITKAKELIDFYEQEGFGYVQFIPCMDFRSQEVGEPGTYEITHEEYGQFLCEAFDYWYNDGTPRISIRFFDNMLSVYTGREAELYVHRSGCGNMLVLEQNGDAYPCDFYIHDGWKLGNVAEHSLAELLAHPARKTFLDMKPALPEVCRSCEYKRLCHGGCPRNRKWAADLSVSDPDFFCASYKRIYAHADKRMKSLGAVLRRQLFKENMQRYFKGELPGRNDPCACGSGRKFKNCCLDFVVSQSQFRTGASTI
jgi:uncharacterized protein